MQFSNNNLKHLILKNIMFSFCHWHMQSEMPTFFSSIPICACTVNVLTVDSVLGLSGPWMLFSTLLILSTPRGTGFGGTLTVTGDNEIFSEETFSGVSATQQNTY
jgi:hypothetical protein